MTQELAWLDTMPETEAPRLSIAPYLAVPDAVRAIGWYGAVFDARLVGEVFQDQAGVCARRGRQLAPGGRAHPSAPGRAFRPDGRDGRPDRAPLAGAV